MSERLEAAIAAYPPLGVLILLAICACALAIRRYKLRRSERFWPFMYAILAVKAGLGAALVMLSWFL